MSGQTRTTKQTSEEITNVATPVDQGTQASVDASNSTVEKLYTQAEVDELIEDAKKDSFDQGYVQATTLFQSEIEELSKALAEKEAAPISSISKRGLPQVRVGDNYYELSTVGNIQFGKEIIKAHDLVQDYERCVKLIEQKSPLFNLVEA